MNAYELFEAMDGIDDEILERSELQRKNPLRFLRPGLIAACCVLVLSVMYAQLRYGVLHPTPQVETTVDTPYYNDARYDYPEFDKTSYYALYGVDHEQINAILPQPCPQWMKFEGEAVAAADGNVRTVMLGTLTPVENTELALFLGECDPGVRIKGGAVAYKCGQAEFVMSQTEENDGEPYWVLTASADINSTPVHLEMYVSGENLDPAKKVFEETLQWLGACPEDALDLQELVFYSEPLSWYLPYSREQFEIESGYGSLLPEQDLQVYSDMELEWKNQGTGVSEEIEAVCYQGKKQVLEWTVCFDFLIPGLYNERLSDRSMSMDARELTLHAVEQFVNKNTTLLGKSIYHAVQYENFTIYVCPWDVSAQWLYDQLVRIRDMQRDYSIYLPTEQYSETSRMTTQIIYHGGLLNETCVQVIENNKYILTWTVMDEELLTGTDTPIQAWQLTQDMVSGYLSGEGTGTLLVSYDDVVVRIESNGADVQWFYDQLIAVRERADAVVDADEMKLDKALVEFDLVLQEPDLDGLCLKIWYTSPEILTRFPWDAEQLKKSSEMISVDTQTLSEYKQSLELLDQTLWTPSEEQSYVNARLCCEFETEAGDTVLQIVINYLNGPMFINGVEVEFDPRIFDLIEPFATEELKELWMPEDL